MWMTFSGLLGLVTFVSFRFLDTRGPMNPLTLGLYKGGKSTDNLVFLTHGYNAHSPQVYDTNLMHLRFCHRCGESVVFEFKLLYSFHETWKRPHRVESGRWNCSTPAWSDVALHFWCNLDTECEAGEDEARCYYSGHCGQGYLTMDDRCYWFAYYAEEAGSSWWSNTMECQRRGGYLVSMNTPGEWQNVMTLLRSRKIRNGIDIGIYKVPSTFPLMYQPSMMWADQTLALFMSAEGSGNCGTFYNKHTRGKIVLLSGYCDDNSFSSGIMCELDPSNTGESMKHPTFRLLPNDSLAVPSVKCPAGHLTLDFLACDDQSNCWSSRHRNSENKLSEFVPREACPSPMAPQSAMFGCRNGVQYVPYSFVCDHRQHCVDDSDENLCVFPRCSPSTQFECFESGQCVPLQSTCDHQKDCNNGADEIQCVYVIKGHDTIPPPAIVNFRGGSIPSGSLSFTLTPLSMAAKDQPLCPDTHFPCADNSYCLPVFVRCNDFNDCPGREDEAGCDSVSCPGFYRCRSSGVCLHPNHVCDGVYQCLEQDDELFCNMNCPSVCTCSGLAFTCPRPFHTELHSNMRFLDASGSGINSAELMHNAMLVHLSLSRCGLVVVYNMSLPNLRSLDLSHNQLSTVTADHFSGLMNLQFLTLSNNPLKSLFPTNVTHLSFPVLRTLHLSGTEITSINTHFFTSFPGLQTLNLSHCGVDRVAGSFHMTSKLQVLDTTGCPMTHFQRDLLSGLDQLQAVYADNFKLCCPDTLPSGFNPVNCRASFDEVASCDSLLRSDVYKIFLSIFATLTLLGNIGCFLVRSFYLKGSTSGFGVFVTHLSVSDFLMGVYLAVIGVADRLYQGSYQWEDIAWRHSTACSLAGFLSLLSNEMSAFIICLITLDRFIVLRFPFSSLHFKVRSAHVTCTVVWVVAMVIAVIPLTSVASHWSFYSHTGICIPLPVTRRDFAGRRYAFGVMIVCNFILFVLIALGQAVIYIAVRAGSLSTADSTKKTNDIRLARRLISVAVSDFLCWFPIGLLGLLASSGVPISGELNVSLAILVLPLNSVVNPFLYTINVVLERRRRSRDERIVNQLKTQICEEERTLKKNP